MTVTAPPMHEAGEPHLAAARLQELHRAAHRLVGRGPEVERVHRRVRRRLVVDGTTFPLTGPARSAVKPRLGEPVAHRLICPCSPHHSWMTTTPGAFGSLASARYPAAFCPGRARGMNK